MRRNTRMRIGDRIRNNYGLYITFATNNKDLINYIVNTHHYLWDGESILSIWSLKYNVEHKNIYREFISNYIISLTQEEQIDFIEKYLKWTNHEANMTKALMHPKTSWQLLIYNLRKKYFDSKLNLKCIEIADNDSFQRYNHFMLIYILCSDT